jgi:hypothetical protein
MTPPSGAPRHSFFVEEKMMRLTRFLLLRLFLLSACQAAPTLTETEGGEIYTAVIEHIYTQDDTFGGTFSAPKMYILPKTHVSVGDPDIEQSESQSLSTAVQPDLTLALAHLPAELIWVEDKTAVPLDPATGAVADNGVILTLGNIHSQRNGTVLVSGSIYIDFLAAGGQTYILEKVDGVWQINGTTVVQWVS